MAVAKADTKSGLIFPSDAIVSIVSSVHCCGECGANPGKRPFMLCSRCKRVCYCGEACQRAAWQKHKPVCDKNNIVSQPVPEITYVLLDDSGSMCGKSAKQIIKLLKHIPEHIRFLLFGAQYALSLKFWSPAQLLTIFNPSSSTYTTMIKEFLKYCDTNNIKLKIFIIITDGAFNDPYNFSKILIEYGHVLKDLTTLIIAFPDGVDMKMQDSINSQLSKVLLTCGIAPELVVVVLDSKNDLHLNQLINTSYENKNKLSIPDGYTRVGSLFGYPQQWTANELAKELRPFPDVVSKLLAYMQNIIKFNSAALTDNRIYAILHKVLNILCKETYSSWIQEHQRTLEKDSNDYKNLQELILLSYQSSEACINTLKIIRPHIIGYLSFICNPSPTTKDIIAAVRQNGADLTLILNLFKNSIFVQYSVNSGDSIDTVNEECSGMPVLYGASAAQCRQTLNNMLFKCIGDIITSDQVCWFILITIFTKDYEFAPEVIKMFECALFDDEAYTCTMMGISADPTKKEIDMLYQYSMSISLAKMLEQYKHRMFPQSCAIFDIKDTERQHKQRGIVFAAIDKCMAVARGHLTTAVAKQLITIKSPTTQVTLKIDTIVPDKSNVIDDRKTFREGDIVLIEKCPELFNELSSTDSFKNEPWKNMPSLLLVRSIADKDGKTIVTLEYLDHPFKTGDTRCFNSIKIPKGYKILLENVPADVLANINIYLMELSKNTSNNPLLLRDSIYNKVMYDTNLSAVMNMLYPNGTHIETTTVSVNIPALNILQICNISSEQIINLATSGANPTMPQLVEIAESLLQNVSDSVIPILPLSEPIVFKVAGIRYTITIEQIHNIILLFNSILTSIKGKTTTLRELQNVMCCTCNSEPHYKDAHKLICGNCHWMCQECYISFNASGSLPLGTEKFVEPYCYRCPLCLKFIDTEYTDRRVRVLIKTYPDGFPDHERLRPCRECNVIFSQSVVCGGNDDDLELLCERCRPVNIVGVKYCPGCNMPGIKGEGCDHMTCPQIICKVADCDHEDNTCKCETHYCWECLYIFSGDEIQHVAPIFWHCKRECTPANIYM